MSVRTDRSSAETSRATGAGLYAVLLVATALCASALPVRPVLAQLVERNLPPEPPRRVPAIRIGIDDLSKIDDETRLGPNLRAIVLVGGRATVNKSARPNGVHTGPITVIDAAPVAAQLESQLGRPLTRKLISDIQAIIATAYRRGGWPFVSVTLPPQEVTGGVLTLRVVEFRLGETKVSGAVRTPESFLRERLRAMPGQPIAAPALEADLDWLNRNPFRQVEAVFGPGRDLGQTDLTLRTTEQKPWQVFGGFANSGTRLTDRDRYFLGASAADFLFTDAVASYQATGSRDFWAANGRPFDDVETAKYQSHAGRLTIPLWARSSLDLLGDFVQTNERPQDPFRIRTRTTEGSAIYRTSLSNFFPNGAGDWLAGIELKHQNRTTFFDEIDAAHGEVDVAQLVTGWNGHWADPLGSNSLDARLKLNPGGILPNNEADAWKLYSNGRVSDIRMAFATLEYARTTPLMASVSLLTEISILGSSTPLPDTERVALGGAQAVRGYVIEDGTVDRAVIARDTLYLPAWRAPSSPLGFDAVVVPFLFGDVGSGSDIFLRRTTTLASVGAGLDVQIAANLKSNVSVGYALSDGLFTHAGQWRIDARATVSY